MNQRPTPHCDAVLIGFPDAGKTTLFCALTGTEYSYRMPQYARINGIAPDFMLADIGGITPWAKPEKNPGAIWLKYGETAGIVVYVIGVKVMDMAAFEKQLHFLQKVIAVRSPTLAARDFVVAVNYREHKPDMNLCEQTVCIDARKGAGLAELRELLQSRRRDLYGV